MGVLTIFVAQTHIFMTLDGIPHIKHAQSDNFFLLCSPCAIESEDMAMRIAERVVNITDKLEIPYIFKEALKKQTEVELTASQVLVMKKH